MTRCRVDVMGQKVRGTLLCMRSGGRAVDMRLRCRSVTERVTVWSLHLVMLQLRFYVSTSLGILPRTVSATPVAPPLPGPAVIMGLAAQYLVDLFFFFFKQKTAYEIGQ